MTDTAKQHWLSILYGVLSAVGLCVGESVSAYVTSNATTFTLKGFGGAAIGGVVVWFVGFAKTLKNTNVQTITTTQTIETTAKDSAPTYPIQTDVTTNK